MRFLLLGVLSLGLAGCAMQSDDDEFPKTVVGKGEKLRKIQVESCEVPTHLIRGNQDCVRAVLYKGVTEPKTYPSKPGIHYPSRYLYDVVHTCPCNAQVEFWWHSPATDSSQRKDSFMQADLSHD